MRILIINPILYTAETDIIPKVASVKDTMIYSMCLGFKENGDEPILIAASDYKPEQEEEYPFEIVWMDSALKKVCRPRCLPYLPALRRYMKENMGILDGIITSEVFSLCSLAAVRTAPQKTVVWHELAAHNRMMHYMPSKIWYHVVARIFFSKVIVAARSENARQFISKYCRNVQDEVLDHGVDIHKIKPEKEKTNHFAVVSQLIGRKRIAEIIDKFYQFAAQNAETAMYRLDIIGRGELEEELKTQVKLLGIQEKVIFHGQMKHTDMMPILAKAKALLVYTEKDNNMVSIAESIAAGTPVITTCVPFNAAYIKREELGIAEDNWGMEAMNHICAENDKFVNNCLAYRKKLSASYIAGKFTEIFNGISRDRKGV